MIERAGPTDPVRPSVLLTSNALKTYRELGAPPVRADITVGARDARLASDARVPR